MVFIGQSRALNRATITVSGIKVVPKKDEVMLSERPVSLRCKPAVMRSHRPAGTMKAIGGRTAVALFLAAAWLASGCSQHHQSDEQTETIWFPSGTIIAVTPALNFSGNPNFDSVVVADLMASELSGFSGVGVIGVNRTLAVLAEQGVGRIQSARHALDVCDRLGADAILVFAITEYDPYTPVVGVTAQLYARRPLVAGPLPDGGDEVPASAPADPRVLRPAAECQQVFNAAHERVRNAVQNYADKRKGGESPYGWRQYVVSQERFLRFCCHAIARDLLKQQTYEFGVAVTSAE